MKTPKKTLRLIDFGGYPFDVLLAIGVTTDELVRHITKRLKYSLDADEIAELEFNGGGRTVILKNRALVLRLNGFDGSADDWGLLAHELLHCVFFMASSIDLRYNDGSEEAFTYALQDIVEQAHLALIPQKKKARR